MAAGDLELRSVRPRLPAAAAARAAGCDFAQSWLPSGHAADGPRADLEAAGGAGAGAALLRDRDTLRLLLDMGLAAPKAAGPSEGSAAPGPGPSPPGMPAALADPDATVELRVPGAGGGQRRTQARGPGSGGGPGAGSAAPRTDDENPFFSSQCFGAMVSPSFLALIATVPLCTRAFQLACSRPTHSLLSVNKLQTSLLQKSRNVAFTPLTRSKMVAVDIELRLQEKNIVLPDAAPPAANYVPYVVTGNYIYVAGQIPLVNGELLYKGKVNIYVSIRIEINLNSFRLWVQVPTDYSVEEAYKCARLCGLNIIAQVKAACGGDLRKVKRVVKLVGFVNCQPDFYDIPKVSEMRFRNT